MSTHRQLAQTMLLESSAGGRQGVVECREDTAMWKTPHRAEKGSTKTLRAQKRVTEAETYQSRGKCSGLRSSQFRQTEVVCSWARWQNQRSLTPVPLINNSAHILRQKCPMGVLASREETVKAGCSPGLSAATGEDPASRQLACQGPWLQPRKCPAPEEAATKPFSLVLAPASLLRTPGGAWLTRVLGTRHTALGPGCGPRVRPAPATWAAVQGSLEQAHRSETVNPARALGAGPRHSPPAPEHACRSRPPRENTCSQCLWRQASRRNLKQTAGPQTSL